MYIKIFNAVLLSIFLSCTQSTDNNIYSINMTFINNTEESYTIDINKNDDIENAEWGEIKVDLTLNASSNLIVPYSWKPGKYLDDFNMYGNKTGTFYISINTNCPALEKSYNKSIGIDIKGNEKIQLKAFMSVLKLSYTKTEWDIFLTKITSSADRDLISSSVIEYITVTTLNEYSPDLESNLNTIVKPLLIKYNIELENELILQQL